MCNRLDTSDLRSVKPCFNVASSLAMKRFEISLGDGALLCEACSEVLECED